MGRGLPEIGGKINRDRPVHVVERLLLEVTSNHVLFSIGYNLVGRGKFQKVHSRLRVHQHDIRKLLVVVHVVVRDKSLNQVNRESRTVGVRDKALPRTIAGSGRVNAHEGRGPDNALKTVRNGVVGVFDSDDRVVGTSDGTLHHQGLSGNVGDPNTRDFFDSGRCLNINYLSRPQLSITSRCVNGDRGRGSHGSVYQSQLTSTVPERIPIEIGQSRLDQSLGHICYCAFGISSDTTALSLDNGGQTDNRTGRHNLTLVVSLDGGTLSDTVYVRTFSISGESFHPLSLEMNVLFRLPSYFLEKRDNLFRLPLLSVNRLVENLVNGKSLQQVRHGGLDHRNIVRHSVSSLGSGYIPPFPDCLSIPSSWFLISTSMGSS